MRQIKFFTAKVKSKLLRNDEEISKYLRKQGVSVGENCHIYSNILSSEPYLISIGNNVTISNDVQLINHDNCICKVLPDKTDIFGEISIGNNCFIGARSIILYGVTLADDIIIAAGSVVTHSFQESGIIIGGNPAKKIGDWENFASKIIPYAANVDGLSAEEKKQLILNDLTLIKR